MKIFSWSDSFPVFIATFGPVGYLPIAPGTWGSGAAILIWWFAMRPLPVLYYLIILLLLTAVAVWSSSQAEKTLGHDSGHIVIDEVVGQLIALVICPRSILFAVSGFFIFRLFDIWKPAPINSSQNLSSGWGVVMDDLLAGIYTAIVLFIIAYLTSRYA